MCSTGGLILILLIALFYNGFYTVVDATTSTTTSKVTTAASKSLTGAGHQTITTVKQEHPHRQVEEKEREHDFENVSRHASTATNAPTNDYTRTDGRTSSSFGSGDVGHFIDITRKHKIHYNGLVVSEKTFF